MRSKLALATAMALALVLTGCAGSNKGAAKYPTKQIEYVVPFAAGGGTDLVARAVADYLSKEFSQPVTVVNKPGGGGATGAQAALKQAAADGYTVLANNVSSVSMLSAGLTNPPVKIEDHNFVARVVKDPLAFAVKSDAPWKDLKEFNEWVKKNPDQLTWTSVGPAGISAFAVAEWLDAIGVDFKKTRMVTTTGAADSMPKVAGGHAVLAVHSIAEVHSMVSSGKVKLLAVQSEKRSPYFPNVPTVTEQGIKMTAEWWTGISLPVGVPEHVVKKWDEATAKMAKDQAFLDKLKNINVEGSYLNSVDFAKSVNDETKYFTELATKKEIRK
jgi:tripartite-type tricarboxylate transporter receptor subunit TctC